MKTPLLSICIRCKDGRESIEKTRGGKRFADKLLNSTIKNEFKLRGVKCMSQCKRPCIISLTSENCFTYIFGDLDPNINNQIDSIIKFVSIYRTKDEGFVTRNERPELLKTNILGRLPPLMSKSTLIDNFDEDKLLEKGL